MAPFKLIKQSYEELKKDNLPENLLSQLRGLESQLYTSETDFVEAIDKVIGSEQTVKYKSAILKSVKYIDKKNIISKIFQNSLKDKGYCIKKDKGYYINEKEKVDYVKLDICDSKNKAIIYINNKGRIYINGESSYLKDNLKELKDEFDKKQIIVESGKIYIIFSISISAFFAEKIEKEFYKIRMSQKWGEFVSYPVIENRENGKRLKEKISKINKYNDKKEKPFIYVENEKRIEKIGYYINAFSGIANDELFTPTYELNNKDIILKIIKDEIEEDINKDKDYLNQKIEDIVKTIENWNIKIRITKEGLATIILEKKIEETCFIKNYEEKLRELTKPFFLTYKFTKDSLYKLKEKVPNDIVEGLEEKFLEEMIIIKDKELLDILKEKKGEKYKNTILEYADLCHNSFSNIEKIFSTYLTTTAIILIHIFLKEYKIYEEVAGYLGKNKKGKWQKYLKYPWCVKYDSFDSFTQNTPPLRNYFSVYCFDNIWGISSEDIIYSEEHFDCPIDINKCEKRKKNNCFIEKFGNELLSISFKIYEVKNNRKDILRVKFNQRELEYLAKRDLSLWKGEFCIIASDLIILCASKDIKVDISGRPELTKIDYEDYWKIIIKAFSLLIESKTLANILGRLLYECMWSYKYEFENILERIKNSKDIKQIQKELSIISNLVSRLHLTSTPSNISRTTFVRNKLDAFSKEIGLSDIITSVEKDYNIINSTVNTSLDSKIANTMKQLTYILLPLALISAIFTINNVYIAILSTKDIKQKNVLFDFVISDIVIPITIVATLVLFFFLLFYNHLKVLKFFVRVLKFFGRVLKFFGRVLKFFHNKLRKNI